MAREHPLSWHRVLPVLLVVALGVVAVLANGGPDWYQRLYHPLQHQRAIAEQAKKNHVDPYLIAALINAESGFREGVVSTAGAVGLMQLRPSTAAPVAKDAGIAGDMNTAALSDPNTNIRVGTRYLAYLVRRYDNDVQLALAAYNAGLTNADRWAAQSRRSGRPFTDSIAFPATAAYVEKVIAQTRDYKKLYPGVFEAALQ